MAMASKSPVKEVRTGVVTAKAAGHEFCRAL